MRFLRRVSELLCCIVVGFCGYVGIEMLFRGYSYRLMGVLGAIAFCVIGQFNNKKNIGLFWQGLLGTLLITFMELASGILLLRNGIRMWDYSEQLWNYRGLICPLFSFLWFLLSIAVALFDDYLRNKLFGEEKKHYTFL